jgi:hypothetical protein
MGWHFKNGTPMWFTAIVGLLLADSILHFGLLFTVSTWAQSARDAVHSYRLPFRDGNIYFVQPWLGHYLDARWSGAVLLAALVVLLFLNRDRLERAG